MKLRHALGLGWLFFCGTQAFGQDTIPTRKDSAETETVKTPREPLRLLSWDDPHSPKKATIYSAVIPGLGQAYNRKWLKVPAVYVLMGGTTWAMLEFRSRVKDLNQQIATSYQAGYIGTPREVLIADRNLYRNYRDFAIVGMLAVYGLQVLDAAVDAHFYKLNIDQDLSLRLKPNPVQAFSMQWTF